MNITLTELLKQRPDAEWAAAIGVTERAVAAWRYGARVPSPKIAIQAAKAAGIPLHVSRPDLWEPPSEQAA